MKPALPLFLLALAAPAVADDAGSALIASLGQINGIALACQQPAIASLARSAVMTIAPKTRDNGETFEQATNAAFLAQDGVDCPDAVTLNARLSEARQQLQKIYPAAP
ncbi:MAG: hypothetical protein FWC58_01600 [Desulfobulbus sp.]|nr:hypothetical protein [Desulfobulbus sp.]